MQAVSSLCTGMLEAYSLPLISLLVRVVAVRVGVHRVHCVPLYPSSTKSNPCSFTLCLSASAQSPAPIHELPPCICRAGSRHKFDRPSREMVTDPTGDKQLPHLQESAHVLGRKRRIVAQTLAALRYPEIYPSSNVEPVASNTQLGEVEIALRF